jgi:hypothetical protein
MRRSSDGGERLQGALAAIDDALFGGSPKDRFDLDRPNHEARTSDLKTLNQRIRNLDEFYSRAVEEIKALRK